MGAEAIHNALHGLVAVLQEQLNLLRVDGGVLDNRLACQRLNGSTLLENVAEKLCDRAVVTVEELSVLLLEVMCTGLHPGVNRPEQPDLLLTLVELHPVERRIQLPL